jgi:putative ABC transport system substrate-binding protein
MSEILPTVLESRDVRTVAQSQGLQVTTLEIRQAADISRSFDALGGGADALYVVPDSLLFTHFTRINTLVLGAKLPTIHGNREYVVAGGLMSYGPNFPTLFRRAADYVTKSYAAQNPLTFRLSSPPSLISSLI